jgi:hypothetical protein
MFWGTGASLQDALYGVLKEADAAYRSAPAGKVLVASCENGMPATNISQAASLPELKELPMCNAVIKSVSPSVVVNEWAEFLSFTYGLLVITTTFTLLMTLGWRRFLGMPSQLTPTTLEAVKQS